MIVEFADADIERVQEEMARAHGFVLIDHRHELFGVCSDCRVAGEAADRPGDSC
jgi:Fur family ferric uptake transcriptional regulator